MYSRNEIVSITRTSVGEGQFATRSSCEMVLAVFRYHSDAMSALKGMVAAARPGTILAIRHHYSETASALYEETLIPAVELDVDIYDGVPADTGTV